MTPNSQYRACQGRELHYTEWGSQHSEVAVAWHGLARTGLDMDDIAAHLGAGGACGGLYPQLCRQPGGFCHGQ